MSSVPHSYQFWGSVSTHTCPHPKFKSFFGSTAIVQDSLQTNLAHTRPLKRRVSILDDETVIELSSDGD